MKKTIPVLLIALILSVSCHRKYYTNSFFEQQTANHKVIAVLPSEIVFTGKQPKELTPEQIAKMEEEESKAFQMSLYGSIMRYANTNKTYMWVGVQDVTKTINTLEQNQITIRDSWKMDDKKLAAMLGVDAIVRMADGKTYNEALENVQQVIAEWIETAQSLGRPIPEPKGRSLSA